MTRFRFWAGSMATMALLSSLVPTGRAVAASTSVVISQIYSDAATSCDAYQQDYIELHNLSASDVDMDAWSVQYSDAGNPAGTPYQKTNLTNETIAAGAYFLIYEGDPGGTCGPSLPLADAVGVINLGASSGQIALRTNQTLCVVGSCATDAATLDFVGYGTAEEHEGAGAAPSPVGPDADLRAAAGEQDTDVNSTDFAVKTAAPRNSTTTPLDETGPTAQVFALSTFQADSAFMVGWSASDPNGVARYQSRGRSAPPNAGFSAFSSWYTGTSTSATYHAVAGQTVCVSTRAQDGVGNWGAFTAERCTAVPLDDRALTAISFTRQAGAAYYLGTYSLSTVAGAKLKSPTVTAKRFALLATKCPTCGSVRVTWLGTTLATVSLHAPVAARKVLIPLPALTTVQAGVLQITSLSAARVEIDGLGVSRK